MHTWIILNSNTNRSAYQHLSQRHQWMIQDAGKRHPLQFKRHAQKYAGIMLLLWLLLDAVGCCRLVLAVVGFCRLLLVVVAASVVDVVAVVGGGGGVVWFWGRGDFLVLSEGFQTTIQFCITCGVAASNSIQNSLRRRCLPRTKKRPYFPLNPGLVV